MRLRAMRGSTSGFGLREGVERAVWNMGSLKSMTWVLASAALLGVGCAAQVDTPGNVGNTDQAEVSVGGQSQAAHEDGVASTDDKDARQADDAVIEEGWGQDPTNLLDPATTPNGEDGQETTGESQDAFFGWGWRRG